MGMTVTSATCYVYVECEACGFKGDVKETYQADEYVNNMWRVDECVCPNCGEVVMNED